MKGNGEQIRHPFYYICMYLSFPDFFAIGRSYILYSRCYLHENFTVKRILVITKKTIALHHTKRIVVEKKNAKNG